MPTIPTLTPDPQLPEYRYNTVAKRYISPNGRFVSQATIRNELDKVLDGITGQMVSASQRFRTGAIDGQTFQMETMKLIKQAHLVAGAMEKGGWYQMSQSDFGRIGQIVKREYGFHQAMLQDIQSGRQKLDGTLDSRLRLYAQAARGTYHDLERVDRETQGYDEERRILHAKDSCIDCVSYAGLKWQPIGSLPRIGNSVCRSNCHCTFIYRRSSTGETV